MKLINNKINRNVQKQKIISISELAKLIGLINKKNGKAQTHTLRFWEKNFKNLKPTILSGNRRYYFAKDVEAVKFIKFLLKDQGLTIEGAKKIINSNINNLDEYKTSRIKAEYFVKNIKTRSKTLLNKFKKLKKNNG
jgi:DNA-binding transcriptional MerR regulator|tara:strand:+ start:758 stop:1168 length:411 start_codon:yes stop_codon:yes gene_type:complete